MKNYIDKVMRIENKQLFTSTDTVSYTHLDVYKRQADYTGLVKYYDTWSYVENGVLNWNYTGPTEYYGTTYRCV